ncbi:unnamed protein product, partial [Polarella glacialis]
STNHAFSEELLVQNPEDRELRAMARKHHFSLTEVEKIKKVYCSLDTDRSGIIEELEFRAALAKLWNVEEKSVSHKRMRQFWLEVDTDQSGGVNFEEFMIWYMQMGKEPGILLT